MKAVTADRFLFIKLVRQSVEKRVRRQRVMKRGIENGDVRDSGERLPHLANAGDDHRIMQRCERIEFFHFREEFVTKERGFSEFFAPMNNAMRHNTHVSRATDDASFL